MLVEVGPTTDAFSDKSLIPTLDSFGNLLRASVRWEGPW